MLRFILHYPETNGLDGDMLDAGPIAEVAVAAERAGFDGWMPMAGGAQLSSTARTVAIESQDQLAAMIREVQERAQAAGRPPVDILHSYGPPGLAQPAADADRHREAFAALQEIGVTWLVVSPPTRDPARVLDHIAAFGATYLR